MLTMHTKGNVIYWRDAHNGRVPGDRALARKVQDVNGFDLVPVDSSRGASRRAGGASANWLRHTFGRPALTIELTPFSEPFASAPKHFNRLIWKNNKALLLKLW
jgi:hypothetical protein